MHTSAKYRVPLAFILTPVIASLILVTTVPAGTHSRVVFDDVLVVVLTMSVATIVMLPVFMWADTTDRLHLPHAVTAGFIAGALPVLMVGGGLDSLMYGLIGAVSGAIFWFAALFRNPFYPHAKLVAW